MPGRAVTVKAAFAPLPEDAEKPCDGGTGCPSYGFTDLGSVGTWYHEAVDYVLRNGLMNGYSATLFGPDDYLSRAQLVQILYNREGRPLAAMLWRYAGTPAATEKELHFNDAGKASAYALEALRWAAENGVLNGYGDGRLNPGGLATRAQAAQMIKNFLEQA